MMNDNMMPEFFSENTRNWFRTAVGEPTPVQQEAWRAVANGGDVLISAPTGTGKTLAAFLYALDALASAPRPLADELEIIYISPLKALGNDIRENLKKPLAGLGLEGIVRTAVRTGDTTPTERARMTRRPPHILITTPESLHLMLTSEKSRRMLASAKSVIIDEVHSVMGTKRGAHLMLSLERLDALCEKRLQRIALSATVKPLETAADYISGGRGAHIVAPEIKKALDIRVELAEEDMRVLPNHSIWPSIAEKAYELSRNARTMLAFVDGRQQAERLAHNINLIAGERYARTHHGCVSKEQRLEAEQQLRSGELRILCCTSSMELGIDVGDIDLVLQIGAPGSISAELQRAGRAGHGPGRVSSLIVYPKTGADTFSAALAARGGLEGRIEPVIPPEKCFDVLAQHIVSMAAADELTVDEALDIVTGAWNFRDVTRDELEGVLRMLAGDFEHSREKPVRPRIIYDRINDIITGDSYTRMLAYANVGTIPDRGWYGVHLADGTRLGELDEEYVYEARIGDKFLLGAFAWRINEITRDRVIVSAATPEGAQPPFWKGDMLGRPIETGRYYGRLMRGMNRAWDDGRIDECITEYPVSGDAADTIKRHIRSQIEATGCLPDDRTIIFEHFKDPAGENQLMIHSVFGMRVNRALSILLRHKAAKLTGRDVRGYDDDDGILLYIVGGQLPDGLIGHIEPEEAWALMDALLPAENQFSMAYRYAAARVGMMGMHRGGRQPLWVQRLRGAESLSAAVGQEGHPLIEEALRECRDDMLDITGAVDVLRSVRAGDIRVVEIHNNAPSPMALPLRRQAEAEMMYDTVIPARAKEVSAEQLKAISPDKAAVEKRFERNVEIDSPERLHSVLMAEGDMIPGEADVPAEWFEILAASGRAMYIEPGLWIAAEHAEEYAGDDLSRIIRRLIRFRGAQNARSVGQRYAISEQRAKEILDALAAKGEAAPYDGMFIHPDIYASAQRLTISMRRAEISTVPPERFARLMAMTADAAGSPQARLRASMNALMYTELPAAAWEDIVLPRRVPGYRIAMLDGLLSEGELTCVLRTENGKPFVKFVSSEDVSIDEYVLAKRLPEELAPVLAVLEKGGAQFDYVISKRLGGEQVAGRLHRLFRLGLVRQDSFAPVRHMLDTRTRTVQTQSQGRWSRAGALNERNIDEIIAVNFRRMPILCRETCQDIPWAEALERLRQLEMAGIVRRGYFVSGLSGAQFVTAERFSEITAALASENSEYICLNAADPAQIWGKALRHTDGREFLCIPGTAVVMRGGMPVCVFERSGAVLRMFEDDAEAVKCFADDFRARRIFPNKHRIVLKEYPKHMMSALDKVGFTREALDYVMYSD